MAMDINSCKGTDVHSRLNDIVQRNGMDRDKLDATVYKTILLSVFATTISNISRSETEMLTCRKRLRVSQNKPVTVKNVVFESTGCKLSDDESKYLLELLEAFFNKKTTRKIYGSETRRRVLYQQDGVCAFCGKKIEDATGELDHDIPWSFVGDELGEKNLQMLCMDCNRHKSNNVAFEIKSFLIKK